MNKKWITSLLVGTMLATAAVLPAQAASLEEGGIVYEPGEVEPAIGWIPDLEVEILTSYDINQKYYRLLRLPLKYYDYEGESDCGAHIEVFNYHNTKEEYQPVSSQDNRWTISDELLLFRNMNKVADYWCNNLGLDSYDDYGSPILGAVHYGVAYDGWHWGGRFSNDILTFGDGDKDWKQPARSMDITAHEMMKRVVDYTAGLSFNNTQSAALRQSWGDAFAMVMDRDDWTFGEGYYQPDAALRDIARPDVYGQARHMSDITSGATANFLAGIPNRAFYGYVERMGGDLDTAFKVWYQSLFYMTPYTDFKGAKSATLQAASALYGSGQEYDALVIAWDAVGL